MKKLKLLTAVLIFAASTAAPVAANPTFPSACEGLLSPWNEDCWARCAGYSDAFGWFGCSA